MIGLDKVVSVCVDYSPWSPVRGASWAHGTRVQLPWMSVDVLLSYRDVFSRGSYIS
jgi:hypothetical protein